MLNLSNNIIDKIPIEIINKIPIEIIDKIINYRLSFIHRLKFKKSLTFIPLESIFIKIKYIEKIYINRNYIDDFLDIILELTSYDERIKMITLLNTCKCCNEHQIRRPTLQQFLNKYVPEYSTSVKKIKKCKCNCRSFCRDLCRAQNDEIIEF